MTPLVSLGWLLNGIIASTCPAPTDAEILAAMPKSDVERTVSDVVKFLVAGEIICEAKGTRLQTTWECGVYYSKIDGMTEKKYVEVIYIKMPVVKTK